jgi:hypothetical protein
MVELQTGTDTIAGLTSPLLNPFTDLDKPGCDDRVGKNNSVPTPKPGSTTKANRFEIRPFYAQVRKIE